LETKKPHIVCDEYSLPADVKAHVDFITPTVGFDAYLKEPWKVRSLLKRDAQAAPVLNISQPVEQVVAGSIFRFSSRVSRVTPDASSSALLR